MFSSKCNAYFLAILNNTYTDETAKPYADKALKYLTSRGISEDDIKQYQIGFVMRKVAEQQAELEGNRWAKDKTRECFIIHPIRNESGETVNLQLEDFLNRGKALNTKFNLQGREITLWYSQPLTEERKQNSLWYVSEGIYDAIALSKWHSNTIALLGEPLRSR